MSVTPPPAPVPGLPVLAGLCTIAQATAPGLSVDATVARLKRLHGVARAAHGALVSRLTAEPQYELKMLYSHHAWLLAELVAAIRARVGEMREPPLGLEDPLDPALQLALDEVTHAPDGTHLCAGLYTVLLPALDEACGALHADAHPLADAPTRHLLRHARLDLADILMHGRQAADALAAVSSPDATWLGEVRQALAAAGGVDGTAGEAVAAPSPRFSATPRRFDPVPRRDARFPDPYNMAVNAEAFIYDTSFPPEPKLLMLAYKRLREIDVPEMMASIIVETPGKPWGYVRDMTRQLWDEARHAMMGEVLFAALGVDWPALVRVNFTWSLGLNTQIGALDRHAVLYFIEQGLMPRHGKRYEWEIAQAAGSPLAATFQDYDWADEVLHARIGKQWYVAAMPSQQEALRAGDRAWSRVLMDWGAWKRDGLTNHDNWWPALYADACRRLGWPHDPRVAAFDTSYAEQRADLKSVSHSG
ncbi:hypothetical protein TBR22_A36620 [Luteitalea sp. TBR-22]|uniref:hypothetical protein n=1 Tax=Luteitalea sp. TBR-22 TaxID=2802971 RepID=UPI001AFAAB4A|nr:hypothetical protein [Luteitalea sp. TBR-22]BCS34435.1 hypothetical protein TBR22_A36620 [Luteitalea sp. TBR-22]